MFTIGDRWHTHACNLNIGALRPEDCCEFKDILGHIKRPLPKNKMVVCGGVGDEETLLPWLHRLVTGL